MIVHICPKCEREYSQKEIAEWGATPESSGYGPTPKCVEIVTDERTKAGAVCGSPLSIIRV